MTYTWSASSPDAGLLSGTSNSTTMTAVASGVYNIQVIQTVNGSCTSASVNVTVNPIPPTPTALSVSPTNPSICG